MINIVATTEEGFLVNWLDWTEAIAKKIAVQQCLVLTAEHFAVLIFVRDFYKTYHYSPIQRLIVKHLNTLIPNSDSTYLKNLFPQGPRQICLLAGLPKPARCI